MTKTRRPGGGRKPLPSSIKIMRGSDKQHPERMNRSEPTVPNDSPICPPHVVDEIAKAEWVRMCDTLQEMGMLSSAWQQALEIYVNSYAKWRKAVEMVDKIGLATVTKNGKGETVIVRNPFSSEAHRYGDECFRLLTEFGLTPSSKTRVSKADASDDLMDFLREGVN